MACIGRTFGATGCLSSPYAALSVASITAVYLARQECAWIATTRDHLLWTHKGNRVPPGQVKRHRRSNLTDANTVQQLGRCDRPSERHGFSAGPPDTMLEPRR